MPPPPWIARLVAPYRAGVAGLDRRVLLVVGGSFLSVAARMSLVTFLAIHFVRDVGLDVATVGAGYLLENLARGLLAPVSGAWSDRVGRRRVLLVGLAGLTLVFPLCLLVRSPVELFAWSVALGAAGAIQQPASSALLMDLVAPGARQRALALNYAAIALGYTLGVAPAGFLAERSIVLLALASDALFALVFLLYLVGLRGPLPREAPGVGRAPLTLGRGLALAPRDPAFVAFAAAAIVFPISLGLTTITSTVFAADVGLSEGAIGLILSINGVLLVLFAIPVQVALEKRGPFRALGASAALIAVAFLLLGFVPGIAVALTLHVVTYTMGEFLFGPSLPAAVAELAPRGARGAYQGAWGFVFAVGNGSALFLSGVSERAWGWPATWALAAGVTAAGSLALFAMRARLRRIADERAREADAAAAAAPSP